jgi:hypothetical protein
MREEVIYQTKLLMFCALVLGLGGFLVYTARQDRKSQTVDCSSNDSNSSAYLILKELDTGSRHVTALIQVSNFNFSTDTLEIESVSAGPEPNQTSSESRLLVSPTENQAARRIWHSVELPYDSDTFYYPFEHYVLDFHIRYENGNNDIPIKLQVWNNINELIVAPCTAHYSFEGSAAESNSFSISLGLYGFMRAITAILYLVAFIFLAYILKKEETSRVLTNSLGYLAALWGIRQIIIGSSKLFPTVIDFVTLGLYLIVVGIVTFRWLVVAAPPKKPD